MILNIRTIIGTGLLTKSPGMFSLGKGKWFALFYYKDSKTDARIIEIRIKNRVIEITIDWWKSK